MSTLCEAVRPAATAASEPVRTWRNLLFMLDGRTVLGAHVFASEAEAGKAAAEGERELARLIEIHLDAAIHRRGVGHLFFCREYSHCVQIPEAA